MTSCICDEGFDVDCEYCNYLGEHGEEEDSE